MSSGYLCPKCGASTRTLETRQALNGFVLRRKRECFNEHGFYTYEIGEAVWNSNARTMQKYMRGVAERMRLSQRNAQVARELRAGKRPGEIAEDIGVSLSTMTDILRKIGAPDMRKHGANHH